MISMISFGDFVKWRWLEKNAIILAGAVGGGVQSLEPRVPGPYFGDFFGDYFGDFFNGSV
jgi:hypothetical protein